MLTLENCIREWDAAGRHGTPAERIARTARWMPYYAYLAERQQGRPYTPAPEAAHFVSELSRLGLVTPDSSVLDIGAGTGGYSLPLAQKAGTVTALEPCGASLSVLTERADKLGVTNIRPVCDLWETWQPETQFDLVLTAMCPAVCNGEELQRMEALSRGACGIVTVMRGSADRHRKAMMAALNVYPQGGMVTEAIHYYNALYLLGRRPEVRCYTVRQTSRVPAEAVLAQYPVYFKIFGVEEAVSVPFLEKYLAENAVDGALEDESVRHMAMITWRPHDPGV